MPTLAPLADALLPHDLDLLRGLGDAAYRQGVALWVVGGAVRDALRGTRVLDMDLTSEASAEKLGPSLASALGGRLTSHSQFGTVKLRFDGRTLDLATARAETYARPGALPTVFPGSMQQDLARRDFSINAMAASLAPDTFGQILDPEGGLTDLKNGHLRALHGRSFQDDATRILRGVRYATRLGFRFAPHTYNLLRRDLSYLDSISPPRLRRELERMLEEEAPAQALRMALRLGVLRAIHPSLDNAAIRNVLRRAGKRKLTPLALFGALIYPLPANDVAALSKRLGFTIRQRTVVEHVERLRTAEPDIARSSMSKLDRLIRGAPSEAIEACGAASDDPVVRKALLHYLRRSATFQPPLNGHDLISLGVPEGPEVGRLLKLLRQAALDGTVRTRQGAISFVTRNLQESKQ